MAISRDIKINITGKTAKFEKEVYLFQGDKNIDLYIDVIDAEYRYDKVSRGNVFFALTDGVSADIKIFKPNESKLVLKDIPVVDGKIRFTITPDICDQLDEIGVHELQIVIKDNDIASKSIPPVQFEVLKPLFLDEEIVEYEEAIVETSKVGFSKVATEKYQVGLSANGDYVVTNWQSGDLITAAKLLKIENKLKSLGLAIDNLPTGETSDVTKTYVDTQDTNLQNQINTVSSELETIQNEVDNHIQNHPSGSGESNGNFIIDLSTRSDIDSTGNTDTTQKLQEVLDMAANYGHLVVLFGSGTYLTGMLRIHKNTTLKLKDDTTILRNKTLNNKSMFINGEFGNKNYAKGYDGDGNISISGGIIDGNYTDEDTELAYGSVCFAFSHGKNISIENVKMYDVSNGDHVFDIAGCSDVIIRNCEFNGVFGSLEYRAEMIQIDYAGDSSFPHFGSGDNTQSKNITIEGNIFRKNPKNTKSTCRTVLGNHSISPTSTSPKNITFKNNVVEGWIYTCISFPVVDGLTIEGNEFNGLELNNRMVYIKSSTYAEGVEVTNNISLRNNIIKNIHLTATDSKVIDIVGSDTSSNLFVCENLFINTFSETSANPAFLISVNKFSNVEFANNSIDKYSKGININSCTYANICNNTFNKGLLNSATFYINGNNNLIIKDNKVNNKDLGTVFSLESVKNNNLSFENNYINVACNLMVFYTGGDLDFIGNKFVGKAIYSNKFENINMLDNDITISNWSELKCSNLTIDNNSISNIGFGDSSNKIIYSKIYDNTFNTGFRIYSDDLYLSRNTFTQKADIYPNSFSRIVGNSFLQQVDVSNINQTCFMKNNLFKEKINIVSGRIFFENNDIIMDPTSVNQVPLKVNASISAKVESNNIINVSSNALLYFIEFNASCSDNINTFNNNLEGLASTKIKDLRSNKSVVDYCKIVNYSDSTQQVKKVFVNSSNEIDVL